jgi:arylsulfatase A-like enzyme
LQAKVPGANSRPRDVLRAALGFGLVAGWIELGSVLAQRSWASQISMSSLRTNQQFVWMIPVCDVLLFGAVGLLVASTARYRPGIAGWLSWRLYTALASLMALLAVEGLWASAGAVLACGLGWCAGPAIEQCVRRRARIARLGSALLGAGLVVLTFTTFAHVTTKESRELARRPPAPAGVPNLLWIVLDNVRAESMSVYGRDRPTTPNLERLAGAAARFTQARSTAPWTLPSHASMFTGQWCHKLSVDWAHPLDGTYPTLAEYLAGNGYATAGFVGNTYYCHARYGLDRGFARYEDYYENQTISLFEVLRSSSLGKCLLQALGFPLRVDDGRSSIRKSAEMLNRDVLSWLDARPGDRPFFVFLNYFDAHSPFIPPQGADTRFGLCASPEARKKEILDRYKRLKHRRSAPGDGPADRIEREATELFRDSYESCIAYIDRYLDRLLDELGRRGLREKTLVIVTSDHGEHFNEHGFLGHGLSLYRGEVHVPLLIFPPSGAPGTRVVPAPVSLRELPATVVELLGVGDRAPFPGPSLSRFWSPELTGPPPPHTPVLSEVAKQKRFPPVPGIPATLGPVRSLVTEGKVYIRNGDGREELYDLLNDPQETDNLVDEAEHRALLPDLRRILGELIGSPI